MSENRSLPWEDVQSTADEIYNVWVGQPELGRARRAWELVVEAGLASYSNEVERMRAYIRFLTVGAIYRDLCRVAFEEGDEPTYSYWIDPDVFGSSEMFAFRFGQLLGQNSALSKDETGIVETAFQSLIEKERGLIAEVLTKGFSGAPGLFVSLWRSKDFSPEPRRVTRPSERRQFSQSTLDTSESFGIDPPEGEAAVEECADTSGGYDDDDWEDEDYYESDDEILNDFTYEKLRAYEWIENGCPSIR